MIKKDMIKLIQKREAELFLELKHIGLMFGSESEMHKRARSEWIGVNQLMENLGIKADLQLPEAKQASELILREPKY